MNQSNAIVQGSLKAISQSTGKSLAESFLSCDVILIVDNSGSMSAQDSRGGRSRRNVAAEELAHLQNSLPGKIALITFATDVMFCPSGILSECGASTDMGKALQFVKVADIPGIKFILISDGVPNEPEQTLKIAKTFTNKIDTIFVGPEDDREGGRAFLDKLSKATGGISVTSDRAKELQASIQTLLLKG